MEDIDISKFLSFVLRHRPDAIGLTLDEQGWASIDSLLLCSSKEGRKLDRDLIEKIAKESDKKRFAISDDGKYIRALQGHSTSSVSINYPLCVPPQFLYHGTATRFLGSIQGRGLLAGARKHVHLSSDVLTAEAVGKRYGIPIVLKIQAGRMHEEGFKFYCAENGVWLTVEVPAGFIEFPAKY